jgi:CheY-like chemotaxis protein
VDNTSFSEWSTLLTSSKISEILQGLRAAGKIIHHSNNVFQALTIHLQYAEEEIQPGSPAKQDVLDALKRIYEATRQYTDFQRSTSQLTIQQSAFEGTVFLASLEEELLDLNIPVRFLLSGDLNSSSFVMDTEQFRDALILLIQAFRLEEDEPTLRAEYKKVPGLSDLPVLSISVTLRQNAQSKEDWENLFLPFAVTGLKEVTKSRALLRALCFVQKQNRLMFERPEHLNIPPAFQVSLHTEQGIRFELMLASTKPFVGIPPSSIQTQDSAGTGRPAGKINEPLASFPPVVKSNEQHQRPTRPGRMKDSGVVILLADDNPIVRDVCQRILEQMGVEVDAARDGAETLRLFQSAPNRYDLIILDVIMPQHTGTEVAEEIFKSRPEQRILFTSGYYKSTDEVFVFHPGIKGILPKPFSREQFVQTVERILTPSTA